MGLRSSTRCDAGPRRTPVPQARRGLAMPATSRYVMVPPVIREARECTGCSSHRQVGQGRRLSPGLAPGVRKWPLHPPARRGAYNTIGHDEPNYTGEPGPCGASTVGHATGKSDLRLTGRAPGTFRTSFRPSRCIGTRSICVSSKICARVTSLSLPRDLFGYCKAGGRRRGELGAYLLQ